MLRFQLKYVEIYKDSGNYSVNWQAANASADDWFTPWNYTTVDSNNLILGEFMTSYFVIITQLVKNSVRRIQRRIWPIWVYPQNIPRE